MQQAETESPPGAAASSEAGSKTILVVDDDDAIRDLTVHILAAMGYCVLTAPGLKQAQEIAEKPGSRIDLLVTDLKMAGGNGFAVAASIKRIHPEAKTLYISGNDPEEVSQNFQIDLQMEFLPKPFGPSGLALKVREILGE